MSLLQTKIFVRLIGIVFFLVSNNRYRYRRWKIIIGQPQVLTLNSRLDEGVTITSDREDPVCWCIGLTLCGLRRSFSTVHSGVNIVQCTLIGGRRVSTGCVCVRARVWVCYQLWPLVLYPKMCYFMSVVPESDRHGISWGVAQYKAWLNY